MKAETEKEITRLREEERQQLVRTDEGVHAGGPGTTLKPDLTDLTIKESLDLRDLRKSLFNSNSSNGKV